MSGIPALHKSTILLPDTTTGSMLVEQEAWLDEGEKMAIFREGDHWQVRHLPSGANMTPFVRTSIEARDLALLVGPLMPAEGELGVSPYQYMTPDQREVLRRVMTRWLGSHAYRPKGGGRLRYYDEIVMEEAA